MSRPTAEHPRTPERSSSSTTTDPTPTQLQALLRTAWPPSRTRHAHRPRRTRSPRRRAGLRPRGASRTPRAEESADRPALLDIAAALVCEQRPSPVTRPARSSTRPPAGDGSVLVTHHGCRRLGAPSFGSRRSGPSALTRIPGPSPDARRPGPRRRTPTRVPHREPAVRLRALLFGLRGSVADHHRSWSTPLTHRTRSTAHSRIEIRSATWSPCPRCRGTVNDVLLARSAGPPVVFGPTRRESAGRSSRTGVGRPLPTATTSQPHPHPPPHHHSHTHSADHASRPPLSPPSGPRLFAVVDRQRLHLRNQPSNLAPRLSTLRPRHPMLTQRQRLLRRPS